MCIHAYKNNIDEMCDEIDETMKQIEGLGKECELRCCYIITVLVSGSDMIHKVPSDASYLSAGK